MNKQIVQFQPVMCGELFQSRQAECGTASLDFLIVFVGDARFLGDMLLGLSRRAAQLLDANDQPEDGGAWFFLRHRRTFPQTIQRLHPTKSWCTGGKGKQDADEKKYCCGQMDLGRHCLEHDCSGGWHLVDQPHV